MKSTFLKVIYSQEDQDKKSTSSSFISAYDSFIDISNFEGVEEYFRTMALHFYEMGYEAGHAKRLSLLKDHRSLN